MDNNVIEKIFYICDIDGNDVLYEVAGKDHNKVSGILEDVSTEKLELDDFEGIVSKLPQPKDESDAKKEKDNRKKSTLKRAFYVSKDVDEQRNIHEVKDIEDLSFTYKLMFENAIKIVDKTVFVLQFKRRASFFEPSPSRGLKPVPSSMSRSLTSDATLNKNGISNNNEFEDWFNDDRSSFKSYRDSPATYQATPTRVGSAIISSKTTSVSTVGDKNFMPGVSSDLKEGHSTETWDEMVKSLGDDSSNNLQNSKAVAESEKTDYAFDVSQKKDLKREANNISKRSNSSKKDINMDSDDDSDTEKGKNKGTVSDMVDLVSSDEENNSPPRKNSPNKRTDRIRHSTGNNAVGNHAQSTSFDFDEEDSMSDMASNVDEPKERSPKNMVSQNSTSNDHRSTSTSTKADGAFKINLKKQNLLFDTSGSGPSNDMATNENNLLEERAKQEKNITSYRSLLSSNEPTAKKCNNAISHSLFKLFKEIDAYDSSNKQGFPFWGTSTGKKKRRKKISSNTGNANSDVELMSEDGDTDNENPDKDSEQTEKGPEPLDVSKIPRQVLVEYIAQAIRKSSRTREKILAYINGRPFDPNYRQRKEEEEEEEADDENEGDKDDEPQAVVVKYGGITKDLIRSMMGISSTVKDKIVKNGVTITLVSQACQTIKWIEDDEEQVPFIASEAQRQKKRLARRERRAMAGGNKSDEDSDIDSSSDDDDSTYKETIEIVEVQKCQEAYCPFCNAELTTNFLRHLIIKHEGEEEVRGIKECDDKMTRSKKRGENPEPGICKRLEDQLVILRNRGNFSQNAKVLTAKKGKIIVVKNPNKLHDVSKFAPCLLCLGFLQIHELWKHINHTCPLKKDRPIAQGQNNTNINKYIVEGKRLLFMAINPKISPVVAEVISQMKDDETTEIIKNDEMILTFGSQCVERKEANVKRESEYVKSKMKQLARLLKQLQKQGVKLPRSVVDKAEGRITIEHFIVPEKFDDIVKAAQVLIKQNHDKGSGVSLNIGESLRKICSIIKSRALRNEYKKEGTKIIEKVGRFLNYLDTEWADKVNARLLYDAREQKTKTIDVLPGTKQCKKLVYGIKEDLQKLIYAAKKYRHVKLIRLLAEITLVRLIIFNLRHIWDITSVTFENFTDARNAELKDSRAWRQDIEDSMTKLEHRIADTFILMKIKNRKGENIPCLAPVDAKQAIEIILSFHEEHKYDTKTARIFSVLGKVDHTKLVKMMMKYSKQFCEDEEVVTSPKIRKLLATVCQIFDLGEEAIDYINTNLGPNVRQHAEFFDKHEDPVQVAKVSRILLLEETGHLSRLPRKEDEKTTIAELRLTCDRVKMSEEDDEDDENYWAEKATKFDFSEDPFATYDSDESDEEEEPCDTKRLTNDAIILLKRYSRFRAYPTAKPSGKDVNREAMSDEDNDDEDPTENKESDESDIGDDDDENSSKKASSKFANVSLSETSSDMEVVVQPKPKSQLNVEKEIEAVVRFFKDHIERKKIPTVEEAKKCLEERNIESSGWQKVKDIVSSRIKRLEGATTLDRDFSSLLK